MNFSERWAIKWKIIPNDFLRKRDDVRENNIVNIRRKKIMFNN